MCIEQQYADQLQDKAEDQRARCGEARSLNELAGVLGLKHGLREQVGSSIREAEHFANKRERLLRLRALMENHSEVVEMLDLMRDLRI